MKASEPATHRKILARLFRLNMIGTVLISLGVGMLAVYAASAFMYNRDIRELRARISMMTALGVPDFNDVPDQAATRERMRRLADQQPHVVTLFFKDGSIIGDADRDEQAPQFAHRHEVAAAWKTGEGISRRHNARHGKTLLYLARRLPEDGAPLAVVRVAVPVASLDTLSTSDLLVLLLFLAGFIGLSLLLSHASALRVIGPISRLENALAALGAGVRVHRVSIPDEPHFDLLASALNAAADRLEEKIDSLEHEKALSAMILASLPTGIVAVDDTLRITRYNDAAARLLGFAPPSTSIRAQAAAMENLSLNRLLYDAARTGQPVTGEIRLGAAGKTIVDVLATQMRTTDGVSSGILLMLTDLTRIRRLETVRQDFVGNVAHELRTPVTAIRGFAELLAKALADPADPEKRGKYLAVILRQAGQMEMMINDLLTLAGLDAEHTVLSESGSDTTVRSIIDGALDLCAARIAETSAVVTVVCDPDLQAFVHPGLLEQAVANLIDNAVKYGIHARTHTIEVAATAADGIVTLSVTDHGDGIPEEQLDRIFERFYRVDKGRSRECGGTGLGLAIVKHIIRLHHGTATVQSLRGESTTFTLRFPRHPPA